GGGDLLRDARLRDRLRLLARRDRSRFGGSRGRHPGGKRGGFPESSAGSGHPSRSGARLRLPRCPAPRDPDRPLGDSRIREGAPSPDRRALSVNVAKGRVVVTGSVAFDYLMTFPGRFVEHLIPDRLSRLSVSFLVDEMRRVPGGCAPNIAYSLALLGETPLLFATAGRDAAEYRDRLARDGVDV